MGAPHAPLAVRIWRYLQPGPPGECWLWTGTRNRDGYGVVNDGTGRKRKAHRVVYELLVGPIPGGRDLDHTCHNGSGCEGGPLCAHRRCCNPGHLEPVAPAANIARGESSGARAVRTDRCHRGHDLTDPANLKPNARGVRQCRECIRENARRKYRGAREDGLSAAEARQRR